MDDIKKMLIFISENDIQEEIYWNSKLEFFIPCNDIFFWGGSDAEDLMISDLPLLKRSIDDISEFSVYGPILFCARKRKERPQDALYQRLRRKDWPLFDAAGPVRELGFGNPGPREKKPVPWWKKRLFIGIK